MPPELYYKLMDCYNKDQVKKRAKASSAVGVKGKQDQLLLDAHDEQEEEPVSVDSGHASVVVPDNIEQDGGRSGIVGGGGKVGSSTGTQTQDKYTKGVQELALQQEHSLSHHSPAHAVAGSSPNSLGDRNTSARNSIAQWKPIEESSLTQNIKRKSHPRKRKQQRQLRKPIVAKIAKNLPRGKINRARTNSIKNKRTKW
ncbi:unnamed protein product [Allacma fusca]|uniref:Uncharacterized protein n=1 Tax=Allacma fusca TaxID=39272 RepID=A0A8J2KTY5_9HEXA|nr:unnamed protein product [Allacma fusca]